VKQLDVFSDAPRDNPQRGQIGSVERKVDRQVQL